MEITEISACRLCGDSNLEDAVDLGILAQAGRFPASREESVPKGPLRLTRCGNCALVQLRHTFALPELFGDGYGYRSGLNPSMVRHLGAIASWIESFAGLEAGDAVLDIGSNDATTLKAYKTRGLKLHGVDPSAASLRQYYPEGAVVTPDFFNAESAAATLKGKKAKAVTSIAMFYDLPDPLAFAEAVAGVLDRDGVWVLEQSYLPTMLERLAYDTICHEHLEYYGMRQIAWIAERAGLRPVSVSLNEANGGSFRVALVRADSKYAPENEAFVESLLTRERTETSPEGLARFAARVEEHRGRLVEFLERSAKQGLRTYGYGASTKGNVVLQYCGIDERLLPGIAEVNESKFGAFTPGTRIPILSEADVKSKRPDQLLVLPWHFRDFIVEKEAAFLKGGGKLVFPLPELEVVAA
jgi:NDP-4-keto-2,6-dideoxyhexose 3-C-methyltransferase